MSRYLFMLMLMLVNLWGLDVPTAEVKKRVFKDIVKLNAQIIQRSNAKESVMARLGGKVKSYYVQEGQKIKKGQKVARIESLELSALSSKLKLLRKQLRIHNKNYKMLQKLYADGLEIAQNVNKEQRERDETASQIESVKHQLSLMGVSSKGTLQSSYTLYAGSDGVVSKIFTPINSVVSSDTALLSISKGSKSILLKMFVPLRYASSLKMHQKGEMLYGNKSYAIHVSQILPELDEKTQQIVVLCGLDEEVKNLFINAFVQTKLYIGEEKSYLSVKKSALSFFKNEWVVFVPKEKEEAHDEHEGHDHAEHKEEVHDEHEGHDHAEHKEEVHDEHEGHEEEEVPFDTKVVKIIKQNKNYVAIEGLKEHEHYVSDKAYHVKSLLLKSLLGGHGH